MSDTKALNNRLDYVERQRLELEQHLKTMQQQRDAARSEATYFRTECRALADRGNAVTAIQETLTRRLKAHRRDHIPGDDLHQAAVIECQTVLAIVNDILGGQ